MTSRGVSYKWIIEQFRIHVGAKINSRVSDISLTMIFSAICRRLVGYMSDLCYLSTVTCHVVVGDITDMSLKA